MQKKLLGQQDVRSAVRLLYKIRKFQGVWAFGEPAQFRV